MQFPIETIRHSASHVMAAAVKQLYPEAKFDIGPSTEDGFYYDFDLPEHLKIEELPAIEAKMEEIVKADYPFERIEVTRDEAKKMLADQKYKLERLADISDEVGNGLVDWDKLDAAGVDPYRDVLTLAQFREKFGAAVHPFTGVDYIDFYSGIITDAGAEVEVLFGNRVQTLLDYTDTVITCDIHTRARSKRLLKAGGAKTVLGLDDLLTKSVDGSGYNEEYGLLGSNKATEETIKLFPRDCMVVAEELSALLSRASGKHIEAMVYGDGAFKDPVGKIWELADPVVSPGYTKGLVGTPNELKLKYLADNDFGDLKGEALKAAIEERIREKTDESLVGNMVSEGTTPRRLTDLIGSLCDLTSGSGDKGTPIVYIQGYFDNYSND